MRRYTPPIAAFVALSAVAAAAHGENWPQFRGPGSLGVSSGKATPEKWDMTSGDNVKWSTAIPGLGLSSPVIWGDRIYLTTAVPQSGEATLKVGLYGDIQPVKDETPQSWRVICIDRETGRIVWDKEATAGVPKIKRHPKCSHANATAATDGKYVVANFGAEGVYCFTTDGELKWKKDLGPIDSGYFAVKTAQWGFGGSPIIHDGKLILQIDVQENSFIGAFDVSDGRELWRTPRADVPTWSTPAIYRAGGKTAIAVNGWKHAGGYELEAGKEIWKIKIGGDIPVPTPIVADGLVYITNGHGGMRPVFAVKATAEGDITPKSVDEPGEHIAWWTDRRGNYMQTPLVIDGLLYLCFDNGLLSVLDAKTGAEKYKQRLGTGQSGFTSSGVACGKRLYFTSEEGVTYVVEAGPEYKQLAVNNLFENVMATPAISDGVIYIRGENRLIALADGAKPKP